MTWHGWMKRDEKILLVSEVFWPIFIVASLATEILDWINSKEIAQCEGFT